MHPTAAILAATVSAAASPVPSDTLSASVSGASHALVDETHILALVVFGAAAALIGGHSRWALPMMFAALLAFGIVLGNAGAEAPAIDIVLTIGLGLTLLWLAKVRIGFAALVTVAGAYALFHGVSDGFAFRATAVEVPYLVGYAAANLAVVVAGLLAGTWLRWRFGEWAHHSAESWRRWMHSWHLPHFRA